MKITQLPYLGEHKDDTKRIINRITKTIPFSELHEYEMAQVDEQMNKLADPYKVLERKIEHLSSILGCSEADAERILFNRLGQLHA